MAKVGEQLQHAASLGVIGKVAESSEWVSLIATSNKRTNTCWANLKV